MIINPLRKVDLDRKKRASNLFRQTADADKVINKRLRNTSLVLICIFLLIVVRLADITIINKDSYTQKLINYTAINQSFSSPRGTIYDRNGKILVQSLSNLTISYFPSENITEKEEWDLAAKVVDALSLKANDITDRQLKDMYIAYKRDVDRDLYSILSKKDQQKIQEGLLNQDEIESLLLEAVDISKFDDKTRAIYQVKMRMDAYPQNSYKVIVDDASDKQVSYIVENKSAFPGFECIFDWKREYSDNHNFHSILGLVSTQTQGIPSEQQEYYYALDYSLNDRVGISGLEKEYETLLSGTKSLYNIRFDDNGIAYLEEEVIGKNGYDLTLTIDIDLQNKADQILKRTLESAKGNPYRAYFDKVQLVVMNPKTGEIYAMSGATKQDDGKVVLTPTDTYLYADRVGSVVKIATLYMGLNEKVIRPNEVIMDEPMQLKGSNPISSYQNYGLINDITAIEKSSNVYMWHIALRLGGNNYSYNMSINLDKDIYNNMRRYYNMFGLGVKTGLDLPNESVGSIGADVEQANALYYAIGQYDTYTAMQLAQYVSTIANNGVKVKPHLLAYASEVNDKDTVVYKNTAGVVSTIFGNPDYLVRGKLGMENCVTTGFCGLQLSQASTGVKLAAKSGTAENELYIDGQRIDTTNATMIAYGPTEDPEIAIACSAPNSNNGFGNNLQSNICAGIVGEITKEYFSK